MLNAKGPRDVATNAYLKLCRLDVNGETERWARTGTGLQSSQGVRLMCAAPRFSRDGRVAVITIHSGFQGMGRAVALKIDRNDALQFIL